MARYSLFVLKVLLNPKKTNKQWNWNIDSHWSNDAVFNFFTLQNVCFARIEISVYF